MTDPEDRFKYIDDLEIAELIGLAGILVDYDVLSQVPSDIRTEVSPSTSYNVKRLFGLHP